jgi:hypothetical protein
VTDGDSYKQKDMSYERRYDEFGDFPHSGVRHYDTGVTETVNKDISNYMTVTTDYDFLTVVSDVAVVTGTVKKDISNYMTSTTNDNTQY